MLQARRKPIVTDGAARWYNDDACKWLRLKHHVYGTDLKNLMERFNQKIKDRTEQNALMTTSPVLKMVVTYYMCIIG